jgi:uncharacterized protein (DUF58 family)
MNELEIIKKIKKIQFKTNFLVKNVFAGKYLSAFKGQGMEFFEVREYVPGDDIRNIDWNVTAKTGVPHIKKFVEERERTLILTVDVSASNRFGSKKMFKKDLIAEISAVMAFSAIMNGDKVGMLMFSDKIEKFIPPAKGKRHVLRIIREILFYEPKSNGTDFVNALNYLNNILKRKSICFIISDFLFDLNFSKELKLLVKKHETVAVITRDKIETNLPDAGIIEWKDLENEAIVLTDTSSKVTKKQFEEKIQNFDKNIKKILLNTYTDYIYLFTEQEYEKELIKFFKKIETKRAI